MITSKRNSIVLWHFLVLIITDMKCSCLSVLLVYATQCIANCVALAILIGWWLMIYVSTEVMPASVFAVLYGRAPGQSSTSGKECHTVLVGSGVQLQETVSAGTGSCGISSPASQAYAERLFSLCGDLTTRNGTELGCPCIGGYFWNSTVTFCIELYVLELKCNLFFGLVEQQKICCRDCVFFYFYRLTYLL